MPATALGRGAERQHERGDGGAHLDRWHAGDIYPNPYRCQVPTYRGGPYGRTVQQSTPKRSNDGRPRATLLADRAFVVQLRADADFNGGTVTGRIEHVSSGAAGLFDSLEQLIAWMRDAVDRNATRRRE